MDHRPDEEWELAKDLADLHNEGLITLTAVDGDEFEITLDQLEE